MKHVRLRNGRLDGFRLEKEMFNLSSLRVVLRSYISSYRTSYTIHDQHFFFCRNATKRNRYDHNDFFHDQIDFSSMDLTDGEW